MIDFAQSIHLESYIDITALVKKVPKPFEVSTQKDVELAIEILFFSCQPF